MKRIATKVWEFLQGVGSFFRGVWEFLVPIWEEAPAVFIIPAWALFFLILCHIPGILTKTWVCIVAWVAVVSVNCIIMAMWDKTPIDDWASRRWQ